MAQFCGDKHSAVILQVAGEFKERCLIGGGSMLSTEDVWQVGYIQELVTYFVDNLDEGEGDFFEKLETQLSGASVQAKQLASEMLWLMLLPPSNIGAESKRASIQRVFSWSGKSIGVEGAKHLSDEVLVGIGSAGVAYNTLRWRELVYFIRLAVALFKLDRDDRAVLLADYHSLAIWVESIAENESRQLRLMLFFLLFPDDHERIFGNTDRRNILMTFADVSRKEYKRLKVKDIDSRLLSIRQGLEQEYGTHELDYYIEPLKSRWKVEDDVIKEPVGEYKIKENNNTVTTLNQILYGPPGTGKTYKTVNHALSILDPVYLARHQNDRAALHQRFQTLKSQKRIDFVTFHQSFSYEDFVEGIKAEAKNEGLSYVVEDGVFKSMCLDASPEVEKASGVSVDVKGKTIWKMSLGNTLEDETNIYDFCINNNQIRLGYGKSIDFANCGSKDRVLHKMQESYPEVESNDYGVSAVYRFINTMAIGDLVIISDGNLKFRAIAEVTGHYQYSKFEDVGGYAQKRDVVWHCVYEKSLPYDRIMKKKFSQATIYKPALDAIKLDELQALLGNTSLGEKPDAQPYVLIIDEINRGNISSIFGELITLLESSKRSGAEEALSVTLPYSKQVFSVPSNLHIIGTMNTADRSLALMDTALRRRFDFVEMMPQPSLLSGVVVKGIDIEVMLETLNKRIEVLYDREHTLGHAFFMPLKDADSDVAFELLKSIFANKVLPLLEEYFFEDWEKIRLVLGDNQKKQEGLQFISEKTTGYSSAELFGNADLDSYALGLEDAKVYTRNDEALGKVEAYKGIYA